MSTICEKKKEVKWHPIACIFPMLPEDELHDLANDIKTHGQRETIVMLDGMVLDGRNRWMACAYAGVTPRTTEAKRVMSTWINLFEQSYFPFTIDDIVEWDTKIRKNKDTQTKIKVAELHGSKCFWANRGVGECCGEVECGHLIPRCKGGLLIPENCIIECRSHNNGRREMLIEEFLQFNNVGILS